jgi:hypothetical protein
MAIATKTKAPSSVIAEGNAINVKGQVLPNALPLPQVKAQMGQTAAAKASKVASQLLIDKEELLEDKIVLEELPQALETNVMGDVLMAQATVPAAATGAGASAGAATAASAVAAPAAAATGFAGMSGLGLLGAAAGVVGVAAVAGGGGSSSPAPAAPAAPAFKTYTATEAFDLILGTADLPAANTYSVADGTVTRAVVLSIAESTVVIARYSLFKANAVDFVDFETTAVTIEDTADNLLGAVDQIADFGPNAVTVTGAAAGVLSVEKHAALTALTTVDTWTYSIEDTAAALVVSGVAASPVASGINVVVTGAASLTQLAVIDTANGSGALTYTAITGTAADYFSPGTLNYTAFAEKYIDAGTDITVTSDELDITQAQALAAKTEGVVTATVTGTATNLLTLEVGNSFALVVTGNADAEDLNSLNAASTLTVDASLVTAISGSATDLDTLLSAEGLALPVNYSVTVTGVDASLAQLAAYDAANGSGALAYTAVTDSALNLVANTGKYLDLVVNATVTGTATIAQLAAIDLAGGALTYTSITDTGAHLSAGIDRILSGTNVTVTGEVSLAQLKLINDKNAGGSLSYTGAVITDTAAALDANADGYIVAGSNVETTDAATLDELATIDGLNGGGTLTYTAITGGAATFFTAGVLTANATTYVSGAVTVEVTTAAALTVAEANALAALTTGIVTATVTGTTAELLTLTDAQVNAYTLTVVGVVTAKDLTDLDAKTSVDIVATGVTAVSGSAEAFDTLLAAELATTITLAGAFNATVSGTATIAQLAAIDTATTGTLTYTSITDTGTLLAAADAAVLAGKVVTVIGSVSIAELTKIDVSKAGGSLDYTGAVITDAAGTLITNAGDYITGTQALEATGSTTVEQANDLDAATTGKVTATIATTTTLASLLTLTGTGTGTGNAYAMTIDDSTVSVAQLTELSVNAVDTAITIDVSAVTIRTVVTTKGFTLDYSAYAAGDLIIKGTAFNDRISGGTGNDVIYASAGSDILAGGAGNDVYIYSATAQATAAEVIVEAANGGTDTLSVTGIVDFSAMAASNFDEIEQLQLVGAITATFTGAQLTGETITLLGDASNNALVVTATAGGTTDLSNISAGTSWTAAGTDTVTINGSASNDTIIGTSTNDIIVGGAGNDTLTGGAGNDKFVFTDVTAVDTITDFSSVAGANADVLVFDISSLGLTLTTDYAVGAGVVITAANATALAAGTAANHIIIDTAANIALMLDADSAWTGAALAIESDTGRVLFDANADFSAGAVQIGSITANQVAGIVAGNLEFIA